MNSRSSNRLIAFATIRFVHLIIITTFIIYPANGIASNESSDEYRNYNSAQIKAEIDKWTNITGFHTQGIDQLTNQQQIEILLYIKTRYSSQSISETQRWIDTTIRLRNYENHKASEGSTVSDSAEVDADTGIDGHNNAPSAPVPVSATPSHAATSESNELDEQLSSLGSSTGIKTTGANQLPDYQKKAVIRYIGNWHGKLPQADIQKWVRDYIKGGISELQASQKRSEQVAQEVARSSYERTNYLSESQNVAVNQGTPETQTGVGDDGQEEVAEDDQSLPLEETTESGNPVQQYESSPALVAAFSNTLCRAFWGLSFDPILLGFDTQQIPRIYFTGLDAERVISDWKHGNWEGLLKYLSNGNNIELYEVDSLVEKFAHQEMILNIRSDMNICSAKDNGEDLDTIYWINQNGPIVRSEASWDYDGNNGNLYYLRYTPLFGQPYLVHIESDKASRDRLLAWARKNPYHFRYREYSDIPKVSANYYFRANLDEFRRKYEDEFNSRQEVLEKPKKDGAISNEQLADRIRMLEKEFASSFRERLNSIYNDALAKARAAEGKLMNPSEPKTSSAISDFGKPIAGYTLGEQQAAVRRRLLDKKRALGDPDGKYPPLMAEFVEDALTCFGVVQSSINFYDAVLTYSGAKAIKELTGSQYTRVSDACCVTCEEYAITDSRLINNALIDTVHLTFAEGRLLKVNLYKKRRHVSDIALGDSVISKYGGNLKSHMAVVTNGNRTAVIEGDSDSVDIWDVDLLNELYKSAKSCETAKGQKETEAVKNAVDAL